MTRTEATLGEARRLIVALLVLTSRALAHVVTRAIVLSRSELLWLTVEVIELLWLLLLASRSKWTLLSHHGTLVLRHLVLLVVVDVLERLLSAIETSRAIVEMVHWRAARAIVIMEGSSRLLVIVLAVIQTLVVHQLSGLLLLLLLWLSRSEATASEATLLLLGLAIGVVIELWLLISVVVVVVSRLSRLSDWTLGHRVVLLLVARLVAAVDASRAVGEGARATALLLAWLLVLLLLLLLWLLWLLASRLLGLWSFVTAHLAVLAFVQAVLLRVVLIATGASLSSRLVLSVASRATTERSPLGLLLLLAALVLILAIVQSAAVLLLSHIVTAGIVLAVAASRRSRLSASQAAALAASARATLVATTTSEATAALVRRILTANNWLTVRSSNISRLVALFALDNVEFELFVLAHASLGLVRVVLDYGGLVHEYVLVGIVTGHEAIAVLDIEPLDCASHFFDQDLFLGHWLLFGRRLQFQVGHFFVQLLLVARWRLRLHVGHFV